MYPMSSDAHVEQATVRLRVIGVERRLRPCQLPATKGQWVELDVFELLGATARGIIKHTDPAAPPRRRATGLMPVAPWVATDRCTILERPRPVPVHHNGAWLDGWVRCPAV